MESMLKIATDKRTKSLGPNGVRHVTVRHLICQSPSLEIGEVY
jgi:hypothetical protein